MPLISRHNIFRKGLLLMAAMGTALCVIRCSRNFSSDYQATSCETAIQQTCNARELQSWATNLLTHEIDYTNAYPTAHPSLTGIWKHRPSVQVRGTNWGNSGPGYVYISWGSGMLGGWGMAIGDQDLPAPAGIGVVRQWQPGIHFWRRLQ
jgi:hypothetical protein